MCAKACPIHALLLVEVKFEAARVPYRSIINLSNGLGVKRLNKLHPELEGWRAGRQRANLSVCCRKRRWETELHREARRQTSKAPAQLWGWWSFIP